MCLANNSRLENRQDAFRFEPEYSSPRESFDLDRNPFVTVEVLDSGTGVTAGISNEFSTAVFSF